MEAEFELDTAVERDVPERNNRVDLNLADVTELATVPGVGPTLAARIIAYREEHGPFLLTEEVTAVNGIGPATYERMRAHVAATLPEELPSPEEEMSEEQRGETTVDEVQLDQEVEEKEEAVAEEASLQPEEGEKEEEMEGKVEGASPEVEEEAVVEEAAAPEEPEAQAAWEPALPPPEPKPEPAKAPSASRLWVTGILAAFAGGLLGVIFTLLVFAGLNGSLDLNQTEAIVGLRTQLETVTLGVESLGQDVSDLRQRLDALESLTTRMDQTEAAVETLQDDVSTLGTGVETLQEETSTLEQEVGTLSEALEAVTEDVEKARTFFERLQVLLGEVFGEVSAPAPPESDQ
ncbi:MAG: helix-hairpin-helix domain-containing protein [Anaerolineae bacterium]